MKSKAEILEEFSLFSIPTGGIGSWLTEQTHADIFERLGKLDEEPLPAVQVNQLFGPRTRSPCGGRVLSVLLATGTRAAPVQRSRSPWLLRRLAAIRGNDRLSRPPHPTDGCAFNRVGQYRADRSTLGYRNRAGAAE